jgi:hypothetical protein
MPNGHGGFPYLGGPILFALLFTFFVWLPLPNHVAIIWGRLCVCLILAAMFGWRVAYYIHMYHADEYDGAYTPPEIRQRAIRQYRRAIPLYVFVAIVIGLGTLWWRGLLSVA